MTLSRRVFLRWSAIGLGAMILSPVHVYPACPRARWGKAVWGRAVWN